MAASFFWNTTHLWPRCTTATSSRACRIEATETASKLTLRRDGTAQQKLVPALPSRDALFWFADAGGHRRRRYFVRGCRHISSKPCSFAFKQVDCILNDDQRQIRQYVRDFVEKEVAPHAETWDKSGSFSKHLFPLLGDCGFLGPTAPPSCGGLGLDYLTHVIIMEELSRASGGVGLSYAAHSNLCINQICRWASPEQQQNWLPKLIKGTSVGALAMSEQAAGSDVLSMKTYAVRNDDGSYTLRGSKSWVTNGPSADVVVVYAKTPPNEDSEKVASGSDTGRENARSITAFIVEKRMPGFHCGKKLDKLGMRCSETCELFFDNVRIPQQNILGPPGKGIALLMSGLDIERLVLAGGPVGIIAACLDVVLPYINTRIQFGIPVGDFELMQGKLADMYTAFLAQRAMLYTVAHAYSIGTADRLDCAAVILSCAERATAVALDTIQMLGANGYMQDYPAGRLLRDSKLYEIGAGGLQYCQKQRRRS